MNVVVSSVSDVIYQAFSYLTSVWVEWTDANSYVYDMADKLQKYKYIVRNTARQHGYTATFMPKPLFGDNGSGMHCHQSLWKNGDTLFFDESKYALLSDTARYYIGGILKHAPALCAITAGAPPSAVVIWTRKPSASKSADTASALRWTSLARSGSALTDSIRTRSSRSRRMPGRTSWMRLRSSSMFMLRP